MILLNDCVLNSLVKETAVANFNLTKETKSYYFNRGYVRQFETVMIQLSFQNYAVKAIIISKH